MKIERDRQTERKHRWHCKAPDRQETGRTDTKMLLHSALAPKPMSTKSHVLILAWPPPSNPLVPIPVRSSS